MEKVSVIVPFYGVEQYIEECLASLLGQTYHNIEILCIDDQSPDNSLHIVEKLAKSDDRIKILRHDKNKGLGGARNTGISHASGSYICFVDSDDYVADSFIESLHAAIEDNNADISVCSFAGFYDDKGIAFETRCQDDVILVSPSKDNVFDIADMIRGASWLKMYKREALLCNGIFQPENRYYEGVVFWLRSIFYSNRIATSSETLYFYRQRPGSIMRSFSPQHIDDRLDFVRNIDLFFRTELLSISDINLTKAVTDATKNLLKHLRYGTYLIENFGGSEDKRREYDQYYSSAIKEFEQLANWPDLRSQMAKPADMEESNTDIPSSEALTIEKIVKEKEALADKTRSLELAIARKTQQHLAAQQQLDALLNSRSWRMTAPIRKLLSIMENKEK